MNRKVSSKNPHYSYTKTLGTIYKTNLEFNNLTQQI